MQIKKPMELERGDVFEADASLGGVHDLEVDEPPLMFQGLYLALVKTCEIDWPIAIPADEDVRVVGGTTTDIPENERIGLIVVVGCGRIKRDHPAPAGEMYVGSFHRLCREAADALRPDVLFILSAKYGLVSPGRVIKPYDTRLGGPGSVLPARLERQAKRAGAWHADRVIVLAGRDYVTLARTVWPEAIAPLEGARGIGEMRSILTKIRDGRCS